MYNPWLSELVRTLFLVLACWLVGTLLGNGHFGITVGIVAALARLYYRIFIFYQWFTRNRLDNSPQDSGIMENLFHRGLYLQNRFDNQKKNMERIIRRFQESARAMPDAVIVLNQRNETLWINKAARKLMGLKRKKDLYQIISNLIRHPEFTRYLARNDFKYPIELPSPINERTRLQAQIIPYGRDSRLLIVRDITQIHNLEKMRRDLIANASHELRTPLTVITGYLETLHDMTENETKEIINTMLKQAQRMEAIINDTLLLARLESLQNHKEHGRKPVMMDKLIAMICEDAKTVSGGRHHFKIDIDPYINLSGNESELHSALANLVQNAVHHTPPGSNIHITWAARKGKAEFTVEDNGQGIAAEHLCRLTERFYRMDTGRSREQGGTGLGLTIVEQIIKHHDGQLHIESQVGQGTRFICEFPPHLILNQTAPQLKAVG